MTFGQLKIFVIVAELQGFSLAAQRLGISQSAVSHALKKLEKSLGVDLIERNKSQASLTKAGARLLPRAREILGLSETIQQEAADIQGVQLGSLRIGSFGPTSSLRLLPQILEAYRKDFPDIEVHIDEGSDEQVIRWIQERRVDIGFVVLPDDRFETTPLCEDKLVALVPKASDMATKTKTTTTTRFTGDKLRLEELCNDPFIMTEAGSAQLINQLFSASNLTPNIRYRNTQIISTLAMVARGEGVALVAEMVLPSTTKTDDYVVREIDPPCVRSIGLALHNARQASPATQAFIKTAIRLKKEGKIT